MKTSKPSLSKKAKQMPINKFNKTVQRAKRRPPDNSSRILQKRKNGRKVVVMGVNSLIVVVKAIIRNQLRRLFQGLMMGNSNSKTMKMAMVI